MIINVDQIKELRNQTGVSVMECKKAIEEARGDLKKAKEILRKIGAAVLKKKQGREAREGRVEAYIHLTGKIGAVIVVSCETDFVSRTEDFKNLAHELAMQVAAMNPKDTKELLGQPYIRDITKTVGDFLDEEVAKLGEKIEVREFKRFEISK